MKHTLKLQPKYFELMKNGIKTIEVRLLDEKRQQIKVGDEIEFLKEPEREEKLLTLVKNLYFYPSFEELLNSYPIENFAGNENSKEELMSILNTFYSKEEQEKYGVVGIRVEVEKVIL